MYRLRDNLYHCRSGGRSIFLDVDANKYFCLSDPMEQAFAGYIEGSSGTAHHELDTLVARGVLVPDKMSERIAAGVPPPIPISEIGAWASLDPSAFQVARAIAYQISAALSLRYTSLAAVKFKIAERSARVRRCSRQLPNAEIAKISAAFERTSLVLASADRCLVRSLALMSMMHAYGIAPRLIFGVRTNPFSAHSWVQLRDVVLNDTAEHARLFVPILVI
ncbi:lasso peptide biosynthesis B2 protein [Sphingobium sp. KCTC 72723]|uniref:lasso peptide biosynthesis B2 protein n=1 Tax=Sphingobium sp. KCTC 72723 TaxID=2733867 RepID=UPI00165E78EA|nr:lasso peptide biosynthesis B2 protein [Sphingobium sp. KCTC 72723]